MSYNGINPSSYTTKSETHIVSHSLDKINPMPVEERGIIDSVVIPSPPPAVPVYDFVLVPEPIILKQIVCETIISGILAKRIELYDTNSPPTGSEPLKFGFILTDGIPTHNFNFPENGLEFTQGIGIRCADLGGGGSISDLIATFIIKQF